MHARVTGRDLAAAMKTVLTVIEKRTTIPILSCARLKIEGAHLTIDGTYPDYKRVIPDASRADKVLTFDGERLRDAVNRVLQVHIANGSRGRAISFKQDDEGKIILSSSAMGEFTATARTFAEWPEEFDITGLGYNGHYLLQFIQPGKMRLATEGSGSPALISFEGEEDITRVAMPMRV